MEPRVSLAIIAPADAHSLAARQLDPQRITERRGDLLELEHLLRVGLLVDAVERRYGLSLQVTRHRFVGRQHEFLDECGGRSCAPTA